MAFRTGMGMIKILRCIKGEAVEKGGGGYAFSCKFKEGVGNGSEEEYAHLEKETRGDEGKG